MTKLTDAVRHSDMVSMRNVIASGADVNERENGLTPLLWAIFRGDVDAVHLLLESGADPNVPSDSGGSPLWHAEDDFGLKEITELLKSRGAAK